jgi:hypothetical protein
MGYDFMQAKAGYDREHGGVEGQVCTTASTVR